MSCLFSDMRSSPRNSLNRWQVLHLFLGEVQPDTEVDSGHGGDRDGDFLVPPKMPLPEQDVGHLMVVWMDEEAMHLPDLAIECMDVVAGTDLCLTHRNDFLDRDPREVWYSHGWLGGRGGDP